MRKTKKYYRDLINKDKNSAFSIAEEVITKYGTHLQSLVFHGIVRYMDLVFIKRNFM